MQICSCMYANCHASYVRKVLNNFGKYFSDNIFYQNLESKCKFTDHIKLVVVNEYSSVQTSLKLSSRQVCALHVVVTCHINAIQVQKKTKLYIIITSEWFSVNFSFLAYCKLSDLNIKQTTIRAKSVGPVRRIYQRFSQLPIFNVDPHYTDKDTTV